MNNTLKNHNILITGLSVAVISYVFQFGLYYILGDFWFSYIIAQTISVMLACVLVAVYIAQKKEQANIKMISKAIPFGIYVALLSYVFHILLIGIVLWASSLSTSTPQEAATERLFAGIIAHMLAVFCAFALVRKIQQRKNNSKMNTIS